MCEICNNSINRDYTHSRSKQHLKHLYKIMKTKQQNNYFSLGEGKNTSRHRVSRPAYHFWLLQSLSTIIIITLEIIKLHNILTWIKYLAAPRSTVRQHDLHVVFIVLCRSILCLSKSLCWARRSIIFWMNSSIVQFIERIERGN